jgi:hypothetical protein
MYFVLALLCTDLDEQCMIKTYPNLLPSYEACLVTEQTVINNLWKFAPPNASSVNTWCIALPEDT